MIAAMAQGRVIGSENGEIPWSLPRDQAHFREYTQGKWVLVGRKTYEEMTGWFGDRTPIIITRKKGYTPAHSWHRVSSDVREAIRLAQSSGARELVVIGGSSLYQAALPFANRLVLTRIDAEFSVEKPVTFPDYQSASDWSLIFREDWQPDPENPHRMELEIFDRRTS